LFFPSSDMVLCHRTTTGFTIIPESILCMRINAEGVE
jgi:hypothetical protein